MKIDKVSSLIAAVLLSSGVAACDNATQPDPPYFEGIIVSRAPRVRGIRDGSGVRLDSTPSMKVLRYRLSHCEKMAEVSVGSETDIRMEGVRVDTSALTIGRLVSVWITGAVRESCAPQVGASRIQIHRD